VAGEEVGVVGGGGGHFARTFIAAGSWISGIVPKPQGADSRP
jgi:protein involved in ribonucleotide reduction